MTTLKTFIRDNKVRIESVMVDENPHMIDQDWQANHYKVTLFANPNGSRHQMTLYYSMGIAHEHEPEADDVLNCLASDSSGIDQPFEAWATDYGYDLDSRKAEKIYRICCAQAEKLEKLLGRDQYQRLLYDVEAL